MTTVNPIGIQQTTAPAFKGNDKKALEAIDKLCFELPKRAVRDAETKAVQDQACAEAHTKLREFISGVIAKMKNGVFFPYMKLTPEQAMIERMNGMAYAAQGRSKEDIKVRVMNEAMIGNKDFIAGVNEYLAKHAAKNGYKK